MGNYLGKKSSITLRKGKLNLSFERKIIKQITCLNKYSKPFFSAYKCFFLVILKFLLIFHFTVIIILIHFCNLPGLILSYQIDLEDFHLHSVFSNSIPDHSTITILLILSTFFPQI